MLLETIQPLDPVLPPTARARTVPVVAEVRLVGDDPAALRDFQTRSYVGGYAVHGGD